MMANALFLPVLFENGQKQALFASKLPSIARALKIFWHLLLIYATIKLIFRAREQKIFEAS
ncbi:MAG TPA: hypothetical protein DCY10_03825 [Clostridiales bacterium]|jgi:hypothetical protein|nr:hypothetical protein [Clostridiales bacterium]